MKTVSVIIPAYNYGRYLRDAIDSALAQTYPPLEVIVVDDGSTDETQSVVAAFGDRIRTMRQANAGVAVARNNGIQMARGEYIALLDSDDIWMPRKLELQMALFEADPALGLVHCGCETFDDAGHTLETFLEGKEGDVADAMLRFEPDTVRAGSCIVFPKRIVDEIGGFDERLPPSDDWDFCYRVATRHPFGYVRQALLRYRQHAGGLHRSVARMDHAMMFMLARAFQSRDDPALRKCAYGRAHLILAGSYFQAGRPREFLHHAVKSLGYDHSNFGYFAAYPLRVASRRLSRPRAAPKEVAPH
jgi:glycosyltransferase involved in cell wall biosynthesis